MKFFDDDLCTIAAVQIWKVTLKTHLNRVQGAAASVAYTAIWSAMIAGTIGINDIKEQMRTLYEQEVDVKLDGGSLI